MLRRGILLFLNFLPSTVLLVFCCVALIDFVPTDLQHQTSVTSGGLASQPSTCQGCIDDGSSHPQHSPLNFSAERVNGSVNLVGGGGAGRGGRTVAKQHKTTDKWQEELC